MPGKFIFFCKVCIPYGLTLHYVHSFVEGYDFKYYNDRFHTSLLYCEGDHQNSLFDIVVKLNLPQHLRP
jgi:hypothetical protein